jgi:hypothetical protein
MRRGVWHQCGNRSQRLVKELLGHQQGVGVILSSRDLSFENARRYAAEYAQHDVDVLVDLQFCNPAFTNNELASYPTSACRASVSQLMQISDGDLDSFAGLLQTVEEALSATAIIAPAVKYEAGRTDILDLNMRLFSSAKRVGDALGIPTYASVILGSSVTASLQVMNSVLSHVTAMNANGWYYAFEFGIEERIPSQEDWIERFCTGAMKLACTGRPSLHAYAGPMGLLSLGVGAQGAAIGHWQNLWQFSRGRWERSPGNGGGADAPPRMFSDNLWGTIVYPDEFVLLPSELRNQVFTESPYAPRSAAAVDPSWDRWTANKHLVYVMCSTITRIAASQDSRTAARTAIDILRRAAALHDQIHAAGLSLRDNTNAYQRPWADVMEGILAHHGDDYEFLELIKT